VVAAIITSVMVDAPLARVWEALADLESHPRWMADAVAIEFLGPQRAGVGTVMLVETRIGPLQLVDRLEVTAWEEARSISVDHRGLIRGAGRFDLAPLAGGVRFTWAEDLVFPWWMGGPIAMLLVRPVLAMIWRRNLRRFKARLEEPLSDR
jgi:hypothetical protein